MAAVDQGNVQSSLDLNVLRLNISGLRKKTSFLKHLIIKYYPDIICLQETNISDEYSKNKALYEIGLDVETCFFNYPVTKSNGTAILCNNPGLKINNILFFDEGRTTIVQLQKNGMDYTIIIVIQYTHKLQCFILREHSKRFFVIVICPRKQTFVSWF